MFTVRCYASVSVTPRPLLGNRSVNNLPQQYWENVFSLCGPCRGVILKTSGDDQSVAKQRLGKQTSIDCFLWGPRRYRCYAMVR
jgi:hypothetical protein